jgi:predicted permease
VTAGEARGPFFQRLPHPRLGDPCIVADAARALYRRAPEPRVGQGPSAVSDPSYAGFATMAPVLDVLLVTFPFFALVLCGYVATRRAWLPPAAIGGLNTFVLYFALPCMLWRFGASTPIVPHLGAGLVGVYLACAIAMVALTVAFSRLRRIGWNDAAFGALVAAFPNTGYMGVPLLIALVGTAAAAPALVTILLDLVVTSSLCIALSRLGSAGEHGAAIAARAALRGVLVNPLPWAILLGVATHEARLEPWKPLAQTIGLLADAASPTALFTIGAVLARSQMISRPTPVADYLPIALSKLVVHPLLVLGLGWTAIRLGASLEWYGLVVITLVAALPSASNVAMLAERFGADNGRIARIILASTALAFVTFSAAVTLLVPGR